MAERTISAENMPREFKRGRLETCCPFQGRLGSKWPGRYSTARKIPTPALIKFRKKAIELWLGFLKQKRES